MPKQPDGNALQIARQPNEHIASIECTLPEDMDVATFYDQSILVRDSILGVREATLIGLLLSIGVRASETVMKNRVDGVRVRQAL